MTSRSELDRHTQNLPRVECPWRVRRVRRLNNIVHPRVLPSPLIIEFISIYPPLCSVLTHGPPKPVLSRNPLRRVLEYESPPQGRNVRGMSVTQQGSDSPIPTASAWKKETLHLLNATYNRKVSTPFNFEGLRLPDDLKTGMTSSIDGAEYSRRPGSRGSCECQQLQVHGLRVHFQEGPTPFINDIQPILSLYAASAHHRKVAQSTSSDHSSSTIAIFYILSWVRFFWRFQGRVLYPGRCNCLFVEYIRYDRRGNWNASLVWWEIPTSILWVFFPCRFDSIVRKQQDMKIKLGPEDRRTIVVARSDGGCSISPSKRSQCSYPAIAVEVTVAILLDVDIRPNVWNAICWITKMVTRGMPPRFTQKCWVWSVIKNSMIVIREIQRDFKR